MSINEDFIENRISEIQETIYQLKQILTREYNELSLYEKLSIRYLIIQLVEASVSICLHIMSRVFDERVESYPECFIRLASRNVIPERLAGNLMLVARLRNLLVHRYWEIDDERIFYDAVEGVEVFREFIRYVREFISKSSHMDGGIGYEFRYHKLSRDEKENLLKRLTYTLENHYGDIAFAYVYGGVVEREEFRDVDVGVWLNNSDKAYDYTVKLSAKLETMLRIPIDIHVLNQAPLSFQYYVVTSGKLLFSRDEKLRAEVIDRIVRMYVDFKTLRVLVE